MDAPAVLAMTASATAVAGAVVGSAVKVVRALNRFQDSWQQVQRDIYGEPARLGTPPRLGALERIGRVERAVGLR